MDDLPEPGGPHNMIPRLYVKLYSLNMSSFFQKFWISETTFSEFVSGNFVVSNKFDDINSKIDTNFKDLINEIIDNVFKEIPKNLSVIYSSDDSSDEENYLEYFKKNIVRSAQSSGHNVSANSLKVIGFPSIIQRRCSCCCCMY